MKAHTVMWRGEECQLCAPMVPMVDMSYEREDAGEVGQIL